MQRAQETLNPLFDQALQETLQRVAREQMRRGFFGQLPGSAISQDAAARLEAQRASQISNLAQQLTTMSAQEATRQQAIAAEFMLNNLAQQRAAGQQFGQLASTISELARTWPGVFRLPDLGGTLQAGQQALASTPGTLNPYALQTPSLTGLNLAGMMAGFQPPAPRVFTPTATLGGVSFANPY